MLPAPPAAPTPIKPRARSRSRPPTAGREPDWTTQGDDTPLVFPWVSLPHLAVRFKPVHQFQIRIDGGWGLYNFFFGGSASSGF